MQDRPPLPGISDIENLFELYVEEKHFLTVPQVGLFLYLATRAARQDKASELTLPKLSELMGEPEEKVIECLDRLSDVMLIDENWYLDWCEGQQKAATS